MKTARLRLGAIVAIALVTMVVGSSPATAAGQNLVISQVYGGGGDTGATYTNDFIEIRNRGGAAVDLTGMSVQYASSDGSTWQKTDIAGVLAPGHFYLVKEAQGAAGDTPLPNVDATGTIQMSATNGKVALVGNQTLLTCGQTTNDCFPNAAIIDFVGYGEAANNYEGAPTATLSNTTAALRLNEGCVDTDNNASDFVAGFPTPRGSVLVFLPCTNSPPSVSAGGPYTVAEGASVALSASGSDPNGDPLTYAWDLDNNGTFETAGQSPTFSAAAIDGPATRTVAVRASDGSSSATAQASVTIDNAPPAATFDAPSAAVAGFPFTLALTSPSDPAPADTFTYAFDCGSGYGGFGAASSTTCTISAAGPTSVGAKIADDDGGVSEYRATVAVAGVTSTFDGLCTLVRLVVTSEEIADALCDKLAAAKAAADRGNSNAKNNQLGAFVNQVEAQSGKAITPEDAEVLKRLAQSL